MTLQPESTRFLRRFGVPMVFQSPDGTNIMMQLNSVFLPIAAEPCQLSRGPKACHTDQQRLPQAFLCSPLPRTSLLVDLELPPRIYQSSRLCSGQFAETANQKYPRSKLKARIRGNFKMCLMGT